MEKRRLHKISRYKNIRMKELFLSFCFYLLTSPVLLMGQDFSIEVDSSKRAEILDFIISKDGAQLFLLEKESAAAVKIINQQDFSLEYAFEAQSEEVKNIFLSPNDHYLAWVESASRARFWDLKEKTELATENFKRNIYSGKVKFYPSHKKVLFSCAVEGVDDWNSPVYNSLATLLSFEELSETQELKTIKFWPEANPMDISFDEKYLLEKNGPHKFTLYDPNTLEIIETIQDSSFSFGGVEFLPRSHKVFFTHKREVIFYDFQNEKITKIPISKKAYPKYLFHPLLPNIGLLNKGEFEIWNWETLQMLDKFSLDSEVKKISFHPTQPLVYILNYKNEIEIWNIRTRTLALKLISTKDQNGFVFLDQEGNYFGSRNGVQRVSVIVDDERYNYEAFDLKLNRPDLVLQKIPGADPTIIKKYARLVEERIKFDENQFVSQSEKEYLEVEKIKAEQVDDLPQLTIKEVQSNDNEIITKGLAQLEVKMFEFKDSFKHLEVMINHVPVVKKIVSGKDIITEIIPLQLSHGENIIEAIVENQSGKRSLPQQLKLNYQKPKFTQKICFFGVGVSAYKEEEDLEYAHKDVEDVARFLKEKAPPDIKVETKVLTNNNATLAAIRALKKELQKTSVDDIVILYFAGHGRRPQTDQEWCFKPFDYTIESPGLTDAAIDDLIQESPSRKKIVVLDACYAGEFSGNKNDSQVPINIGDGKNIATRGADEDEEEEESLEAPTIDRIKTTFNDLRNSSGAIIIAASGAKEQAIESPEFSNGVFTYHFLQGLESLVADANFDRQISVAELMAYVHDQISETYGQQPNFKRKYAGFDFVLWNRPKKQIRYDQLFNED